MKNLFLLLMVLFSIATTASAKVVTTTKYQGKTYHVDVVVMGMTADIWFRVSANACSQGDFKVANVNARQATLKAARLACTGKTIYDNSKTVIGCTATVASGICAAATVATDGAAALVCESAWVYTANRGLADCVSGVKDTIASYLMGNANWSSFQAGKNLGAGNYKGAINSAIDAMCASIK